MTAVEFSHLVSQATVTLKPAALNLTRDSEDAKDLVQETLLKAFVNRERFIAGTNIQAWLFTIMRNTFINNYNKVTKRNITLDTQEYLQYFNQDKRFITQNMAVGTFVLADVYKAIAQLPEDFRRPFMMYYVGYKYQEIAETIEIPIGTVKNRIHMARKELKKQLPDYAGSLADD